MTKNDAFDKKLGIVAWLRYSGQDNYEQTCTLLRNERGFLVTIPFMIGNSNLSEWFFPEGENPNVFIDSSLPERIWIEEIDGNRCYGLFNYHIVGKTKNYPHGSCFGRLYVEYLVEGVREDDYSSIDYLQSYYPELAAWSGMTSLSVSHSAVPGDDPNKSRFSAYFDPSESVEINATSFNGRLFANPLAHETFGANASVVLQSRIVFEVKNKSPLTFYDATDPHLLLQELLCISSWENIGFEGLAVARNDDCAPQELKDCPGIIFREVLTNAFEKRGTKELAWHDFCFLLRDIEAEGLVKWFDITPDLKSTMEQISYLARFHSDLTFQAQVLLFGVAFEELAACLQLSKESAPFVNKVQAIIDNIANSFPEHPIVQIRESASCIGNTYNAVKHTQKKRSGIPREEWLRTDWLFEVVAACRAIAQSWLACYLGCPGQKQLEYFRNKHVINNVQDYFRRQYLPSVDS